MLVNSIWSKVILFWFLSVGFFFLFCLCLSSHLIGETNACFIYQAIYKMYKHNCTKVLIEEEWGINIIAHRTKLSSMGSLCHLILNFHSTAWLTGPNEFKLKSLCLSELNPNFNPSPYLSPPVFVFLFLAFCMESCDLDVIALDDEAFSLQVNLDCCILKLMVSCHSNYQLIVLLQITHFSLFYCASKLDLTCAISCA